jgi:hypothetical protein
MKAADKPMRRPPMFSSRYAWERGGDEDMVNSLSEEENSYINTTIHRMVSFGVKLPVSKDQKTTRREG